MSSTPAVPVDLNMNDALAKAIAESTHPDAIRTVIQTELEKQVAAKTAEDAAAATKAAADAAAKTAADAAAVAPVLLSRIETIAGQDIEFTGATDAEIDRAVLNAYKIASVLRPNDTAAPAAPAVDPAVAAQQAADATAARAAANAELELKFKRGELSASEYLEQSGAVADYLAKQGVPVEELRASIEQNRGQKEVQSWADAVEVFKQGPGADWPGGDRNREILGFKLAELGLTDAPDKVAALTQAFASMKASNMIFKDDGTPATTAAPATAAIPAAAATAPAATAAPATSAAPVIPATPARSSGVFGASSGVGGGPNPGAPAAASPIDIPANATPAEIIALWKEANLREGKDPNAEFMKQFASRRV